MTESGLGNYKHVVKQHGRKSTGNTRFDGDMKSTILHHTMELGQDPGWKSITTDAQVKILKPNKGHKTKGDSSNTQEIIGTKELVFWKQASPHTKP